MESLLRKRRYLFEAEDDDTGSEGNGASADDNTTDDASSNDNNDDTSTDDNASDNTDDNQADEENTDDEDYSIDADPDENTDDDTGGDDTGEDSSDDTSSDDSTDDTTSEIPKMDQQMFDSLSDDEKQRKIYTLKKMYVDMYSKCDSLIEKFNQISDEDDINMNPVVKRILKVLYDLKEYISYYLLNSFDKKSYYENDITFSRYLSILNGIKLIVEELQKTQEEDK